jgi:uncharacterized membrane protein
LNAVLDATSTLNLRVVLVRQAEMVLRIAEESVDEQNDLDDIATHFARLRDNVDRMDSPGVS